MARQRDWMRWEGGYEALVLAARELIGLMNDPAMAPPQEREAYARAGNLNERLVRQYVAAGVITPGERRGKEVVFAARQLLQLATARHLMAVERWKLPQIARLTGSASIDALLQLLPSRLAAEIGAAPVAHAGPTPRAGRAAARRLWPPANIALHEDGPAFSAMVADSAQRTRFRREVQTLREPESPPDGEAWIRFRLTDWTEVHVRESALEAWDDGLVDTLAETLKQLLRAAAKRRRRR